MIRGELVAGRWPRISAWVHFPPPVDRIAEIPFLVDTGCSWTTLHPADLREFGSPIANLVTRVPGTPVTGVGRPVQPLAARAIISLTHEDGSSSIFELDIALGVQTPLDFTLPSLLGMDILARGVLTIDGPQSSVVFETPPGTTALPGVP